MQKGFLLTSFIVSSFCFTQNVFSLPEVESRTGQPVIRNQEYSMGEMKTASPEDRIATMTLNQIENLKKEVADLRGILEIQSNEMKVLKKSQQDLYIDLDRRLNQIQAAAPMQMPSGPRPMPTQTTSPTRVTTPTPVQVHTPAPSNIQHTTPTQQISPSTTTIHTPSHGTDKTLITVPSSNPDVKIIPKTKQKNKKYEDEVMLYQDAYDKVKNKRYDEAKESFKQYLKDFPQGEHAANAHYWLGEVQMVQWQSNKGNTKLLENAHQEFSILNEKFPNHTRTADALLKMGIIELENNDHESAKNHFTQVKTRYPETQAARIAETRLQEMP